MGNQIPNCCAEIFDQMQRQALTILLVRRTSTSYATGPHWSTWGALTTMQHNHSRRAASPVRPLRSVPSVPSQPPSTHLIPPRPPSKPDTPLPFATGVGVGGARGRALQPPDDGFNQSPRSHADLTNHMRFCFKKIINMTLDKHDSCSLSTPNLPDCQRLLVALRE